MGLEKGSGTVTAFEKGCIGRRQNQKSCDVREGGRIRLPYILVSILWKELDSQISLAFFKNLSALFTMLVAPSSEKMRP